MQPLLIFKGMSANVIIQLSEETAKFIISGNICCFLLSEYDKELRKIRMQYEDSDQRMMANNWKYVKTGLDTGQSRNTQPIKLRFHGHGILVQCSSKRRYMTKSRGQICLGNTGLKEAGHVSLLQDFSKSQHCEIPERRTWYAPESRRCPHPLKAEELVTGDRKMAFLLSHGHRVSEAIN